MMRDAVRREATRGGAWQCQGHVTCSQGIWIRLCGIADPPVYENGKRSEKGKIRGRDCCQVITSVGKRNEKRNRKERHCNSTWNKTRWISLSKENFLQILKNDPLLNNLSNEFNFHIWKSWMFDEWLLTHSHAPPTCLYHFFMDSQAISSLTISLKKNKFHLMYFPNTSDDPFQAKLSFKQLFCLNLIYIHCPNHHFEAIRNNRPLTTLER